MRELSGCNKISWTVRKATKALNTSKQSLPDDSEDNPGFFCRNIG